MNLDSDHCSLRFLIFQFLSKKLAQEWKDVGRNIGLADESLEHVEADSKNREEANYKMLLQWTRTKGSDATIEVLIEALKLAKRKDLADILEEGEGMIYFNCYNTSVTFPFVRVYCLAVRSH